MASKTKLLAGKLGHIQKCCPVTSIKKIISDPKSNNIKQIFKYLLILDFESTCWEDKKSASAQEIIEFPVVLLELDSGKIIEEFQQYVFPVEHQTLSAFCTKFTGISQDQVDSGVPLCTAIALFTSWLNKMCEKYSFSINQNSMENCAAFATWSDWDLGVCLNQECKRKQLKKPHCFNQWIDIRATYKKFYNRRPQGVAGSLQELGMKFVGREHSGIEDSRNTANLVARMLHDGCIFEITKKLDAKSLTYKLK